MELAASMDLPGGFTVSVDCLLPFSQSAVACQIVRFPLEDVLHSRIIPFVEDTGGDVFCFDYHIDPDNRPVAFWSVDYGLVSLAPDFTSFLGLLHA